MSTGGWYVCQLPSVSRRSIHLPQMHIVQLDNPLYTCVINILFYAVLGPYLRFVLSVRNYILPLSIQRLLLVHRFIGKSTDLCVIIIMSRDTNDSGHLVHLALLVMNDAQQFVQAPM